MGLRILVRKPSATDTLSFIDNVRPDIKLDNIQIMLPDEQDSYLDAFCAAAAEKTSPILSRLGGKVADPPVVASREMEQDELGYPILCDLGSAVFDDEGYPGVVQALPYRAPEVILGAAWDHKVDIWNFGVLVSTWKSCCQAVT
jgi:serine/threonine-protein kinase SRPK3